MINRISYILMGLLVFSCGIINDTTDEVFIYKYRLKNETGKTLEISFDSEENTFQTIENNKIFECSQEGSSSDDSGFCRGFLQIKIQETGKGYRCYASPIEIENTCFVEDFRLFTLTEENTVFKDLGNRVYEYVLTPEILEGAFDLD